MRLFVILFSISFILSGCANKRYAYSGNNEIEASSSTSGQSLDSIINKHKESVSSSEESKKDLEIIFTTTEYSEPDSLGNQYKKKETVGSIKQESSKKKDSTKQSESEEVSVSKSDSTSTDTTIQNTEVNETYEKKASPINRFIFPAVALLLIVGVLYFIWPKIKNMIK